MFIDKNVDLYITGSNAYLLSSELATLLTGRYIEIKMLPLSFEEYLSAFDDKTDISKKFRKYLRYSSFPQAIELYNVNPSNIDMFLDGIYNTILFKDVMARKGITDKSVLERVTKYLYDNIGNRTSMKNISDNIEGLEKNSSYNTVSNYVQALIDSYIVYKVNRYDIKGKEYLKTGDKYYICDLGLRNYLLGEVRDRGKLLENLIFLELKRRGYQIYVGKNDEKEVDFVIIGNDGLKYIQVSESVRDENTLSRELGALENIKDHYPKYLITLDYDKANYNGIKQISAIDFLLGRENI